jgi:hypothetical protein
VELFYKSYKTNKFGYIVGSINDELAGILEAFSNEVVFSFESLEKNLKHHPDLGEDDYLLLKEIIGKTHLVAKDGDKTVAIVLEYGKLYHYALKSTRTGKAVFLTSFRRTRLKQVNRLRNKHKQGSIKIIKDFLP